MELFALGMEEEEKLREGKALFRYPVQNHKVITIQFLSKYNTDLYISLSPHDYTQTLTMLHNHCAEHSSVHGLS